MEYSFSGELTLKSIANYICRTEQVFLIISEGVQTNRQSLEKLLLNIWTYF